MWGVWGVGSHTGRGGQGGEGSHKYDTMVSDKVLLTPISALVSTLSTPAGSSAAAVEACSDKVLLAETLAGLEESGISSPPNLVRGGRDEGVVAAAPPI